MSPDPIKASQQTDSSRPLDSDDLSSSDENVDRLAQALDEYQLACAAGQSPDRQSLLARYADIADELAAGLDSLDYIDRLAPQLSEPDSRRDPPEAVSPGEPLASLGDFRIVRQIGRGGMGVVYESEQLSLGRRVALKVLPFAAVLDQKQLQRFKNEAQAAAALKHPNIVAVYSVGCQRGVHYYAMELVDGKSLAQLIGERRDDPDDSGEKSKDAETSPVASLSTQRMASSSEFFQSVASIGVQAAEALEHAHQRGVVHRDIKPSNLLVDDNGHLWVADFGLAQIESDTNLTMSGDVLGTLRYMSPEQAIGNRRLLDHRTDVYSLGITLYELLTGRPAFDGTDRTQVLCDIADCDPPAPSSIIKNIPRDLETIILRATCKAPSMRYDTMAGLATDLQRFLDHTPIRAQRPSRILRHVRWLKRRRFAAAVFALLSVLLAVSAFAILRWAVVGGSELVFRRAAAGDIDTSGRVSPDGEYLSLANWSSANIAVLSLADGGTRDVTHDGEWDAPETEQRYGFASVWSPDGTRLAYASYGYELRELRVASVDQVEQRALYANPEVRHLWPHTWSADGTQVLTYQYINDGSSRLTLIAAEDGSETVLKSFPQRTPKDAKLSPGSLYVVYAMTADKEGSQSDLYVLDTRTRKDWPLESHLADDWAPEWSPDGRWIVFLSDRRGTVDLWAARIVNGRVLGRPRLIKDRVGNVRPLGFSRTGSYFYASHRPESDLYTASVDLETPSVTSSLRKLNTRFDQINLIGDWSTDGKSLAFLSYGDTHRQPATITVRRLENAATRRWALGHPLHRLPNIKSLRWLADGSRLVFSGHTADGSLEHFQVDPSTGRVSIFADGNVRIMLDRFAFSADGRHIYYVQRDSGHIIRSDVATGEKERIYERKPEQSFVQKVEISDDGMLLAIALDNEIHVMPAGGGVPRVVLTLPTRSQLADGVLDWTPDSRALLFGIREGVDPSGSISLWHIAVAGGQAKALGITMSNMHGLRLHPNGREIMFHSAGREDRMEIWGIDNVVSYLNLQE